MFWVSTSLIFLTQCVLDLVAYFTGNFEPVVVGLGYPAYFALMLIVAKVLGSFALILPKIPARLKEWAYAGFMFDFTAAFISMWVVVGLTIANVIPIVAMVILYISYSSYHKMLKEN